MINHVQPAAPFQKKGSAPFTRPGTVLSWLAGILLCASLVLTGCAGEKEEGPEVAVTETETAEWKWAEGDTFLFTELPAESKAELSDFFEGKSRAEWEAEADASGAVLLWAEGITASSSGGCALFSSNRNCLNTQGVSLFLADCKTGKETLLLNGTDGACYFATGWLPDGSCAVVEASKDGVRSYLLCDLQGQTQPIDLGCEAPFILDFRQGAAVFSAGDDATAVNYGRIQGDGSVSGLRTFSLEEGFFMGDCQISPDLDIAAFKIRESYESPDRDVVLWSAVSGKAETLPVPEIPGASDIAAIDLNWSGQELCVNFSVMQNGEQGTAAMRWTDQ